VEVQQINVIVEHLLNDGEVTWLFLNKTLEATSRRTLKLVSFGAWEK